MILKPLSKFPPLFYLGQKFDSFPISPMLRTLVKSISGSADSIQRLTLGLELSETQTRVLRDRSALVFLTQSL